MEKIKGLILKSLEKCQVVDNWPQYESFSEEVDSIATEICKNGESSKKEWLTESDVYSIYYDMLGEAITAKTTDDQKLSGAFKDLFLKEDLKDLATKIVNFYNSIPRKYEIYIPLPNILQSISTPVSLNKQCQLVKRKDIGDISPIFTKAPVYFQYSLDGYCNGQFNNKTLQEALFQFKVFLQQATSKGLLKITQRQLSGLGLGSSFSHYQVPKNEITSVDVTDLDHKTKHFSYFPLSTSHFLAGLDIPENLSPAEVNKHINDVLSSSARLIASQDPETKRVKAAIVWYFDSYISESPVISFVQICIGLEILLGKVDERLPVTQILADRFAYLVGRNIKEREKWKEEFRNFYTARSNLVHGKTSHEDYDHQLFRGRYFLQMAIRREISNLDLKPVEDKPFQATLRLPSGTSGLRALASA